MKIQFFSYFLELIIVLAVFSPAAASAGTCNGLLGLAGPIISLSSLSFGNYNAGSASDNTANTTITVVCTVTLGNVLPSFTIALSAGGGSFTTRQMSYLTNKLNYNIYTSAALTTVWGDGTGSTATLSYNASSNTNSQPFTAYGRIPKGQYVPLGLYGDTITVTVTY